MGSGDCAGLPAPPPRAPQPGPPTLPLPLVMGEVGGKPAAGELLRREVMWWRRKECLGWDPRPPLASPLSLGAPSLGSRLSSHLASWAVSVPWGTVLLAATGPLHVHVLKLSFPPFMRHPIFTLSFNVIFPRG